MMHVLTEVPATILLSRGVVSRMVSPTFSRLNQHERLTPRWAARRIPAVRDRGRDWRSSRLAWWYESQLGLNGCQNLGQGLASTGIGCALGVGNNTVDRAGFLGSEIFISYSWRLGALVGHAQEARISRGSIIISVGSWGKGEGFP